MHSTFCPSCYFVGSLTEDEKDKICRAIDTAENRREEANPPSWSGKPWVVTAITGTKMGHAFVAHRLGTNSPLVARSLDDLIDQVTQRKP